MRWALLIILIIAFCFAIYFRVDLYLNYSTLKANHEALKSWATHHYFLSVIIFMFAYIVTVALSIPGATILTLTGGFLFGPVATIYVVISATMGALILFLAVRTALGEWLSKRVHGWIAKMKTGFQKNAFNYLLFLRLIPLFPFWAINIAAALLNVRTKTFLMATFLGIIPGALIYVLVGNSLNVLFEQDQAPNFNIIFKPIIFFPLLALACISLLPVIYKKIKGN